MRAGSFACSTQYRSWHTVESPCLHGTYDSSRERVMKTFWKTCLGVKRLFDESVKVLSRHTEAHHRIGISESSLTGL